MLPPTTDALKLHIARTNYQADIQIRGDVAIIDIEVRPIDTNAWQEGTAGLEIVQKRLPTVLTSYKCNTKCKYNRFICVKAFLKCTPACDCDGVNCANNPMDD